MGVVTAPEYVAARSVLLDALTALEMHLDAVVLVGAQAVYLHTGAGDLMTAPTTTDADIALAPDRLRDEPLLRDALCAAGFIAGENPGTWRGRGNVAVDLMVPEALSGAKGRRGAKLPVHGNHVARRTLGLEPALVDNEPYDVVALDPADVRSARIRVAGVAALLVSKIIKIDERRDQPKRLKPKDGLDVLRLLRTMGAGQLAARLRLLASDTLAGDVTMAAVEALRSYGTDRDGPIATLAADAAPFEGSVTISESTAILIEDLVHAYDACGVA